LDEFHVDAEAGGVLDEVLAVAAVHPDFADRGVGGGHLVDQVGAGDGVLHARGRDQHREQESECVGDDAPLAAHDLLRRVGALPGRKRLIGVDTLGLLLAVLVTAASVSDNAGGIQVLSHISEAHPRVTKAWADNGYRTKAIDHGARLGIDVEVVHRDPGQKGCKVIPRRWVVERTFGWLMHHRRLVRDYETHPHRSEAMIRLAMIDLMSRRLTRETTVNWRDPWLAPDVPQR
jgi:transposase